MCMARDLVLSAGQDVTGAEGQGFGLLVIAPGSVVMTKNVINNVKFGRCQLWW